jgi:hypothetical protein
MPRLPFAVAIAMRSRYLPARPIKEFAMRGAIVLLGLLMNGCTQLDMRTSVTNLRSIRKDDAQAFVQLYHGRVLGKWDSYQESFDPGVRRDAVEALSRFECLRPNGNAQLCSWFVLALNLSDAQTDSHAAASHEKRWEGTQEAVTVLLEGSKNSDSAVERQAAAELDDLDKTGELRWLLQQIRLGMPVTVAKQTLEAHGFGCEYRDGPTCTKSHLFCDRSVPAGWFTTASYRVAVLHRDGKVTKVEALAEEFERHLKLECLEWSMPAGHLVN